MSAVGVFARLTVFFADIIDLDIPHGDKPSPDMPWDGSWEDDQLRNAVSVISMINARTNYIIMVKHSARQYSMVQEVAKATCTGQPQTVYYYNQSANCIGTNRFIPCMQQITIFAVGRKSLTDYEMLLEKDPGMRHGLLIGKAESNLLKRKGSRNQVVNPAQSPTWLLSNLVTSYRRNAKDWVLVGCGGTGSGNIGLAAEGINSYYVDNDRVQFDHAVARMQSLVTQCEVDKKSLAELLDHAPTDGSFGINDYEQRARLYVAEAELALEQERIDALNAATCGYCEVEWKTQEERQGSTVAECYLCHRFLHGDCKQPISDEVPAVVFVCKDNKCQTDAPAEETSGKEEK